MIIIFRNKAEQAVVMNLLSKGVDTPLRKRIQGIICYNEQQEGFGISHNEMSSDVAGLQFLDKPDLGMIPKMLGI